MITKDMTIAKVIEDHPNAAHIMLSYGLQCVGCHVNEVESIEDGARGHGMPEEIINKMVKELNDSIEQNKKIEKEGPKGSILTLTQAAITKAKDLMEQEKLEDHGLRIGVVPGGCSGFNYELDFESEAKEGDYVYEEKGLKVYVQKDHIQYLNGLELDYVDSLNQQGFKFNNPNAVATCGCGTSFSA